MKNKEVAVSKRISAYLIDILVVFVLISLISEIRFINPTYDKYIETYGKYNQILEDYSNKKIDINEYNKLYNEVYYEVSKYGVSYNIIIIVVMILYFGLFQYCTKGQTIGKKLMRIRVVNNSDNGKVSFIKYILRIIPVYYLYIGSLLPLIINSILIYVLNYNNYLNVTLIVSYIFLGMAIGSFIVLNIKKDKRGLHDLIANTKVIYEERA